MIKYSTEYTQQHLVCVFAFWDTCLIGLCKLDEDYYICRYQDGNYYIWEPITLDDKCHEYLEDYRKAYKHWFYENGERAYNYECGDINWFHEKWQHKNPLLT